MDKMVGILLSLTRDYRNFGVLLAMLVVFCACHLVAAQFIPSQSSRGEVLVFKRNKFSEKKSRQDEEKAADHGYHPKTHSLGRPDSVDQKIDRTSAKIAISPEIALLSWTDVNYHINDRAILQNAYGWLQPGTLTVLMVRAHGNLVNFMKFMREFTKVRSTGCYRGGKDFSTKCIGRPCHHW